MIESRSGKPFINVMFGNFYCPGYDDKEFVKDTIRFIKNLGFNSVMLDTKDSEDCRERIELKEKPSQYVEMQEYMERESADRSKVRPVIYKEVFVMKDTLKSNEKSIQ